MSDTSVLNRLVNLGRDEILHFIRQEIPFPETPARADHEKHIASLTSEERVNYILFTELRIAMRGLYHEVDVMRIREAMIAQNSDLLSSMGDARQTSGVMAQGWGRMAQIQDAVIALGRMGQTYADAGAELSRKLDRVESALMALESQCLRIDQREDGFLFLLELDEITAIPQKRPELRLVHSA